MAGLPEDRAEHGYVLFQRVRASGRLIRCSVPGCTCHSDKQIHHVVPLRIRPWNEAEYLVVLCGDHHALIERYYWNKLCLLAPNQTRELRRIARRFKHRIVPFKYIQRERTRSRELWDFLNVLTDDPAWWQQTYQEALCWASQQRIVRSITTADVITEIAPWWVTTEVA